MHHYQSTSIYDAQWPSELFAWGDNWTEVLGARHAAAGLTLGPPTSPKVLSKAEGDDLATLMLAKERVRLFL